MNGVDYVKLRTILSVNPEATSTKSVMTKDVHVLGEPERAPNARVTYGNFAVPIYVSMYICVYVQYACIFHHHYQRLSMQAQVPR